MMISQWWHRINILANVLFATVDCNIDYLSHNVFCGPHIDVVPTDSYFTYIPYFVKLHRCQGKDIVGINPFSRVCVPTKQDAIVYKVELRESGTLANLTLFNHTACEYVCKEDRSSCMSGQGWHEATCSCCVSGARIECDGGQEWNNSLCMCVCPQNNKNCGMDSITYPTIPTSISTGNNLNVSKITDDIPCIKYHLVIIIAVVEFIVVILLCVTVFYGMCKRSELVYNLSKVHREEATRIESGSSSVFTNNDVTMNGLDSNRNSAEVDGCASDGGDKTTSLPSSKSAKGSNKSDDVVSDKENNIVVINASSELDNQVYYIKNET